MHLKIPVYSNVRVSSVLESLFLNKVEILFLNKVYFLFCNSLSVYSWSCMQYQYEYGKFRRKYGILCMFLCSSVITFAQQQNHPCQWWYSLLTFYILFDHLSYLKFPVPNMDATPFFFFMKSWCFFKVKHTNYKGCCQ